MYKSYINPLVAVVANDFDIFASVKIWRTHADPVLSRLSANLTDRILYKIRLENQPFDPLEIQALKEKLKKKYGFSHNEESYFVFTGIIEKNHRTRYPVDIWARVEGRGLLV